MFLVTIVSNTLTLCHVRRAVQTSNSIEGSGQTIRGFFFEKSVICPLRSSHQTDKQHWFFNGEVQLIFWGFFFYRKLLIKKVKFIFLLSHKDKFYLKLLTSWRREKLFLLINWNRNIISYQYFLNLFTFYYGRSSHY